jgi:hypothetical protein
MVERTITASRGLSAIWLTKERSIFSSSTGSSGLLPAGRLVQGGVQHPVGQGMDAPGPFGQWDELAGPEQPALGVLPAHQPLDAADLPRGQVGLGLVVQHQLVAFQGRRSPPSSAGRVGLCWSTAGS